MPWFRVEVHGRDLQAAEDALHGAGITMTARAYAHFVSAGPPELTVLAAVVEADDENKAVQKVRGQIGSEYELGATLLPQAASQSASD